MRGDVETIKGRLDISEVISAYVKLEKAGASLKGRCPFHNEKTPSFFVSPARQSFYCFGCGAKGDIFTFISDMEGLDFLGALKFLADKAGVEIKYRNSSSKDEKAKLFEVLEEATRFFEANLSAKKKALTYIKSRGLSDESIKTWRIGYAPEEWRELLKHLQNLGYDKKIILKAGLVKRSDKNAEGEPYDIFRNRVMFPLADQSGRIIAFSGRSLPRHQDRGAEDTSTLEPKYLNSPDTSLFVKGQVLYGLDKAKDEIRKKNYAVLVEGQMDIVLSHQSGVRNTVASSGTAFTSEHLQRLKRFSPRIILAFDGDTAGERALHKAAALAIFLGMETKIASLPEGLDPAEIIKKNPQDWKNFLREALPAVEFFFNRIEERESDQRKLGLEVRKVVMPMIRLLESSMEQAHFVSMLAKRTGLKEEVLWEDLKKTKVPEFDEAPSPRQINGDGEIATPSQKKQMEERLAEIKLWREELSPSAPDADTLAREEAELSSNLLTLDLREELGRLSLELQRSEAAKDKSRTEFLTVQIQKVHNRIAGLEEQKKKL